MVLQGPGGILTPPNLSLNPELTARNASMREAMKPIASKCFRASGVPIDAKLKILQSLILSRGLFGSSTWHRPSVSELRKIHRNVMHAIRSACSAHFCEVEQPVSDQALIDKHGVMAPYTFVRLSRLRLAIRIADAAPIDLNRLLFVARGSAKSWLTAVEDDFDWLRIVSDRFAELRTPSHWWSSFRVDPKGMRKLITGICKDGCANRITVGARSAAEQSVCASAYEQCDSCNYDTSPRSS